MMPGNGDHANRGLQYQLREALGLFALGDSYNPFFDYHFLRAMKSRDAAEI